MGFFVKSEPPQINRHTQKAKKLDEKADKQMERGWLDVACETRNRADEEARKGGWS